MRKYGMRLNELFTHKVSAKWEAKPGYHRAEFTDSTGSLVSVKFYDAGNLVDTVVDVEFDRDGSQAITGTGSAAEVLSSVYHIILDYLKQYPAEYVLFSAREPSRQRLYRAMVNRLSLNSGYTQIPAKDVPGGFGDSASVFALKKITNKQDTQQQA